LEGVTVPIYHGIVRNGVVVFDEGVRLDEGTAVEVHVPNREPEVVLEQIVGSLARMGVRVETKPVVVSQPEPLDRTPIQTTGIPVSRLVLESRQ
jgi:hypothetical protein